MSISPKVERRASSLLAEHRITEPGFDVVALAHLCGATVEMVNLGEDASGVLVRDGHNAIIGVNWAHHPNRQRFTIAHELGHFILHPGATFIDKTVAVRFRDQQSGSGTDEEEKEANGFAAALLMPEGWLRRDLEDGAFKAEDEEALSSLADRYGVSTLAMSFRLQNLELIEV